MFTKLLFLLGLVTLGLALSPNLGSNLQSSEFIPIGSVVTANGTTKTFYGEIEPYGQQILYITWNETIEFCGRYNMKIAKAESLEETTLLGNYLDSLYDGSHFWLGGTNVDSPAVWYWIGEGPLTYFNWGRGHPGDRQNNCLSVYEDGTWRALECDDTKRPLCQLLGSTSSSTDQAISIGTVLTLSMLGRVCLFVFGF